MHLKKHMDGKNLILIVIDYRPVMVRKCCLLVGLLFLRSAKVSQSLLPHVEGP